MRNTSCDLCGTGKGEIFAPFLTLWNGNTFDLCRSCVRGTGLGTLLDKMGDDRDARLQ